ncbi:hypothetical protein EVAR_90238_1 [Eumeta japonica]|uniref:Uncharacterized protein n=1 Tax=Eumeta variegata TaxID=151549 RepID=A0A4C1YRR3_EUMVA|nr:hypothetical protein EVAR_90238_1 [Eumeta japonica]
MQREAARAIGAINITPSSWLAPLVPGTLIFVGHVRGAAARAGRGSGGEGRRTRRSLHGLPSHETLIVRVGLTKSLYREKVNALNWLHRGGILRSTETRALAARQGWCRDATSQNCVYLDKIKSWPKTKRDGTPAL